MANKQQPMDVETAVEQTFAAPDFRQYQKKAIIETVKAFTEEDYDIVLLNAPTGSGKSLIIDGAVSAYRLMEGGSAFITTPLNTLVDQLEDDEFIGSRVITLKGRNNYNCIHPKDAGSDVDKAICQKDADFECEVRGDCPYYGRKDEALDHPQVVTNMSYLMAEGMIPDSVGETFGNRDILAVDECQKLEDFAMNFISFTVSQNTVPEQVWQNIQIPDEKYEDDMDYLVEWLNKEVLSACREMINYLDSVALLSDDQLEDKEDLKQFEMRVKNFLDDVKENDWIAQIQAEIKKNRPNTKKVVFKPIVIGRFLDDLLWLRGDKIILSSATIPGGGWLEEMGLREMKVKKLNVPSTFPVENRPIVSGQDIGKMTYDEREDNMWPMAERIMEIANYHEGERGFVHCRSYSLMKKLRMKYTNNGYGDWFRDNVMVQDKYEREESLEEWFNSDYQVFFSVAMDEGIDLDGDKCRWQVLAKTLYPHMADKRVEFRIKERNDWDWYNRAAAIQIQQAYGRGVRSPEDECVFYILDSSAVSLIEREAELFNSWFLEGIHDLDVDSSRGR